MYPVSDDYKTAILENSRAHRITGIVDGVVFDGADVIRKSFVVKNQFTPCTAVELGGVYIGELDLTFSEAFASLLDIRGEWRGVQITPSIGVEIDVDTFEDVPVGVYTVEDATWVDEGLKIVAYDNMKKLDVELIFDQTEGYLYDFLNYTCITCGITLGMTKAEVEALPNGTELLGIYPGSSMLTFRDMLARLATIAGCFATMDRSGALVLRRLPDTTVITDTISDKFRYSTSFSDYSTYYSAVKVQDMEDGVDVIYQNQNVGGLVLDVNDNPFIQYGVDAVVNQMRQRIADAIASFYAVPFSVSILPNPAYDLGDVIQFTGGIGQNSIGCVMSYVYRVDSAELTGYGENPAASGAMSAEEKSLVTMAANQKSNAFAYYTYTNMQEITLTTRPQQIARIKFAVNELTTVEIWQSVQMIQDLLGTTQAVKLEYYYDGDKISREPTETYSEDGPHLMVDPWYLKNVTSGHSHTWAVYASVDSGTATIDVGDVNVLLKGQKMVAEGDFPGEIECIDEYTALAMISRFIAATDLTEVVTLTTLTPTEIRILDGYDPETPEPTIAGSTEAVNIVLTARQFVRITEQEDYNRVTEEGDYYRATEA